MLFAYAIYSQQKDVKLVATNLRKTPILTSLLDEQSTVSSVSKPNPRNKLSFASIFQGTDSSSQKLMHPSLLQSFTGKNNPKAESKLSLVINHL